MTIDLITKKTTLIDLITPWAGLNELKRTYRSTAFIRSQSMLQTAKRDDVFSSRKVSLSSSFHGISTYLKKNGLV